MKKWCVLAVALALLSGACSSSSTHRAAPAASSTTTTTTAAEHAPTRVFILVAMNVMHGATCDDGPAHCDVTDRMTLLARRLEDDAGCPDVVALEEVAPWWRDLLVARLPTLCRGRYHLVSPPVAVAYVDAEAVLTTLPTSDAKRFELAGAAQRRALRVQLKTSLGPAILVVTHVGTGADNFGNGGASCAQSKDCPPPCDPAGTAFTCQIVQLRDIAAAQPGDRRIATLIAGDMNLVPSAVPLRVLSRAGYVDTYHAAGRAECNPATGAGCTSGRDDIHLATLRDPHAIDKVRVDDIFLLTTARCRRSFGPGTGLFAPAPATNGPGGLAWVSDHTGAELDLGCN